MSAAQYVSHTRYTAERTQRHQTDMIWLKGIDARGKKYAKTKSHKKGTLVTNALKT